MCRSDLTKNLFLILLWMQCTISMDSRIKQMQYITDFAFLDFQILFYFPDCFCSFRSWASSFIILMLCRKELLQIVACYGGKHL